MADISGYLNNIRSAESGETVRDSIIQCLNKINNDNPNKTKPLNVTANGTYTSETGFSYNPVTVNVPAGGASNYTFEELEVTENGEYEPEEDNTMYKKVTVNVPQLANDLAPDGYTITQNGEYDPLLDGYDGYGKIIVNVNEATGDGPFTVEFYDKVVTDPTGTVMQTQTVNKNGSASFDPRNGYPTSPIGQVFMGWNPEPVNVTRDLKCYPRFGDQTVAVGEIPDSWEVICSKGGSGYPIGSFKSLAYGATYDGSELIPYFPNAGIGENDKYVYNTITLMVKVADGEDGSTSSWLGLANTNILTKSSGSGPSSIVLWTPQYWDNDWYSMGNQYLRGFYNGAYFNHMSDIFKQHIKAVTKYTVKTDIVYPTSDKIWIPSAKEIFLDGVTYGEPQGERYMYYDYDMLYNRSTDYFTPEEYEAAKNNVPYIHLNTSPVNYCPNKEIRDLLRQTYNGSGEINLYTRDAIGNGGPAARLTDGGWEFPRRDPFGHTIHVGFCLI